MFLRVAVAMRRRLFQISSFSSSSKPASKVSTALRGTKDYVLNNRQAFVNMFGFFIVFSYSVHNFKIETSWKEMQEDYKKIETELNRVQTSLDDKWVAAIESKVKSGAPLALVLKSELDLVLHPPVDDPKEEVLKKAESQKQKEDAEIAELIKLGSVVEDIGSGKNKGKMI